MGSEVRQGRRKDSPLHGKPPIAVAAFFVREATPRGNEMVRALMAQAVRQQRIARLDYTLQWMLVRRGGRCSGAVVLDENSGEQFIIPAKAVVLSTRWCRPDLCSNDGIPQCHGRWDGDGLSCRKRNCKI